MKEQKSNGVTLLKRFLQLALPFLKSERRWLAISLLGLLGLFSISISGLNVMMSYIGRNFMTALTTRERDAFMWYLYMYLLAFAGTTLVAVFYRYTEERLGLMWRRWLSLKILSQYLDSHVYYKINFFEGIDNPDQRIEEDIRSFTSQTLSFMLIIFNSIITLFAFMGILWSISGYLGLAALAYALLGSIFTYFLGKPLIELNFSQLKKEADYRYKLINVRDNAESIAFLRGEAKEKTRVRQRLKFALSNLREIVDWSRNLNFFTTGYNYIVSILPTVIVAPLYLNGEIEFGVVTQAGIAFAHVLGALSIIVQNFGSLSAFAAVIRRLGTFMEALETCKLSDSPNHINALRRGDSDKDSNVKDYSLENIPKIKTMPGQHLSFEGVSVHIPDFSRRIIKNLTLDTEGKNLLVTGASGSGKSSLFRAVSGIWKSGQGTIVRPELELITFTPQRPYMPLGTLRGLLLYPFSPKGVSDRDLLRALEAVNLMSTFERVDGLDAVHDWPNMLSSGEQQRLSFARMLLTRPAYIFLDESTTALDTKAEEELYATISQFATQIVSIGYRRTLSKYHHLVLELSDGGLWKTEKGGAI